MWTCEHHLDYSIRMDIYFYTLFARITRNTINAWHFLTIQAN